MLNRKAILKLIALLAIIVLAVYLPYLFSIIRRLPPRGETPKDVTAFHNAVQRGALQEVKSILANKPEIISQPDMANCTALFYAAGLGHMEMVKLLIDAGADINTQARNGRTALYNAVRFLHDDIAKLLISKGADVNVKTRYGETVLHFA